MMIQEIIAKYNLKVVKEDGRDAIKYISCPCNSIIFIEDIKEAEVVDGYLIIKRSDVLKCTYELSNMLKEEKTMKTQYYVVATVSEVTYLVKATSIEEALTKAKAHHYHEEGWSLMEIHPSVYPLDEYMDDDEVYSLTIC